MENKEAILNRMPIWTFKDFEEEKFYRRKNVLEAMESYSASQNKELRKENELLKVYEKLSNEQADLITQLQSTIDELQKDLNSYKESFENNKEQFMELATHARDLESTIDEKNKEIEYWKGFIEFLTGKPLLALGSMRSKYQSEKNL